MKLVVISASMRAGSQSLKVATWLAEHAGSLKHEASVLDLHALNLPIYDDEQTAVDVSGLRAQLEHADAFVFVSPEWNGMASVGLFNMLHYVEKEMAYKPVMLVGVSSGRGGTHPLDQMKLMGQKNRYFIISPENLVVSGVENAFNTPGLDDESDDASLRQRADYSLRVLAELARALSGVRDTGVLDFVRFKNGV